jgi:hypothetical protein
MCSELDVSRPTLDLWAETHPDFSYSLSVALLHSQRWWEDAGQEGMTADKFNSAAWSRSMAARFPNDWREKSAIQHDIPTGSAPLFHVEILPVPRGQSTSDLAQD